MLLKNKGFTRPLYIYYLTTQGATVESLRSLIKSGLKKEVYTANRGNINRNIRVASFVLESYNSDILSLIDSKYEEDSKTKLATYLTKNKISTCTLGKGEHNTKTLYTKIEEALKLLTENYSEYRELIDSTMEALMESESESEAIAI